MATPASSHQTKPAQLDGFNNVYQFLSLPNNSTHFRLATLYPSKSHGEPIHLSLRIYPLDAAPPYKSLSYVCGDPDDTRPVRIDGQFLNIYRNLDVALRYVRNDSSAQTIWIDAICIHQQDLDEKNWQVQNMSTIYQNAEEVLAFIGDEEWMPKALDVIEMLGAPRFKQKLEKLQDIEAKLSVKKSFIYETRARLTAASLRKMLDKVGSIQPRGNDAPIPLASDNTFGSTEQTSWAAEAIGDHSFALIRRFYRSPFFSRLWIYREVWLAHKFSFVCGKHSMDGKNLFDTVMELCSMLPGSVSRIFSDESGELNAENGLALTLAKAPNTVYNEVSDRYTSSLLITTRLLWNTKCSDPRDRIYAVLGITTDPMALQIHPDYSQDVSELMCIFTALCIQAHQNLGILGLCTDFPEHIPSWTLCPDSEILLETSMPSFAACTNDYRSPAIYFAAKNSPPPTFCRSSDSRGAKILQLSGFVTDKVKITSSEALPLATHPTFGSVISRWKDMANTAGHDNLVFWLTLLMVWRGSETTLSLEEWQALVTSYQNWIASESQDWPSIEFKSQLKECHRRLIFITEQGRFGVGGPQIRAGDEVCILFGNGFPFILRKADDEYHRLVADCYIHSINNGEAMDDLKAGKYQEQVFSLI